MPTCHYCGNETLMRPYIAESARKRCTVVYPACCPLDACIGQWEPIPIAECSEDLLREAKREAGAR